MACCQSSAVGAGAFAATAAAGLAGTVRSASSHDIPLNAASKKEMSLHVLARKRKDSKLQPKEG